MGIGNVGTRIDWWHSGQRIMDQLSKVMALMFNLPSMSYTDDGDT